MSFPDHVVESTIIEKLQKLGMGPEPCTPSMLPGIRTLDASERDVADTRGLEYCSGLEYLDLSCNKISDIGPLLENEG